MLLYATSTCLNIVLKKTLHLMGLLNIKLYWEEWEIDSK